MTKVEPASPSDLADTVELSWLKYDPRRYGDAAAEVERDETPLWRRSLACRVHVNSFFLYVTHVNSLTCSREFTYKQNFM